ncbi:hypothetical protein [Janibacter anophelis]|uniref:hypothetical protein n=1 Tax=Janibacter anophelis TaxID=319054 RepID=UPI000DF018AE|nr:hypothetical protein [Janibacter anophelis]
MGKHLNTARSCALVAITALGLSACGAIGGGGETVTVTESSQGQSQTSEPTTQATTEPTAQSTSDTQTSAPPTSTSSSADVTQSPPAGSTPNTDTSKTVDVNTLTEKVQDHAEGKVPSDVTLSCQGGIVLVANETQKCSWMDSDGNATRLTITVAWAAVTDAGIEYYLSLENSAYTP